MIMPMVISNVTPVPVYALLLVLKEAVHDQYDYISWWLYEGAEEYMIWEADNSRSWCLREPEALYDYIMEECQ